MNQKMLGLAIILLSATMLATPVLAIGPQKAEPNPNRVSTQATTGATVTELWLPSRVMNEFISLQGAPPGQSTST